MKDQMNIPPASQPVAQDALEEIKRLLAEQYETEIQRLKDIINASPIAAVAPSDAKGKADAAIAGDFSIRGPLTDAQRDECRYLYNNLKHLQAGGYYVADDVIRKAAVYGYTNGYKDFHDPATSAADAKDAAVQWISVSAKRPDIGQKVIACGSNFGPQVLTYGDQPWPKFWCGERGKWWWNDDAMWMPLPDRTAQQAQSSANGGDAVGGA